MRRITIINTQRCVVLQRTIILLTMGRYGDLQIPSLLLWCLLLVTLMPVSSKAKLTDLMGERQRCNNEGEIFPVNTILDTKKCFRCICKNGYVECDEGCRVTDGCHLLIPKKPEECCSHCRGCMYRGKFHESGTEWTELGEPCRVLTCEAAIVTEADLQCYTPCRNPLHPTAGKCCPTCPGCRINGQNVTKERDVTIPEDPCVKCHCEGTRMTCVKKACPILQCALSYQKRAPGECCPSCTGKRWRIHVKATCMVGESFLMDEQRMEKDRCTHCKCANETAICKRKTCPVLECDPDMQKTKPGDCCPQCPPVEEVKTDCTVGGKTYQDGESWQLDPCKSCMCHRGEPRCAMQRCQPRSEPCLPGYKSVKRPGQCCSECLENDGVCTVFGDPHYKTFDGKFFSFQGSCKYQLAADCTNQSFSIRVTNDARNTRHYAWTKTISLKSGDLRVNLGQKLRVKVNGKRIEPPYFSEAVAILRQNGSVAVSTQVGVNLLWDGGGLLEVSVSAAFKGKLCGLCGNYNSVAQDDLTTRRGKLLTDLDIWKFGNSWRVGGKRACGRPNENPYKKPQCKPKNGKNPCRYLKDSIQFGECDSKLNPHNYYEACLQDMCECPGGNCYCEALTAYSHECTRLGVILPDWRRDTRCRYGRTSGRKGDKRPLKIDAKNHGLGPVQPGYHIPPNLHLVKPSPRLPRLPIK